MQLEGGVSQTQVQKELEILLEIERTTRQNNQLDLSLSNSKEILSLIFGYGDLELIKKTVQSLCEKRGQPIKTITHIIQETIRFARKLDKINQADFAESLFKITDQKIYLEAEHAQLCLQLVQNKEDAKADPRESLSLMEGVLVETYGSLTMKEKMEFILKQMRFNLMIGDFTRLFIVGRKITPKHLETDELVFAKVSYNFYLFEFFKQKRDFTECRKCLEIIFDSIQKSGSQEIF